jgi:hypothetical protein
MEREQYPEQTQLTGIHINLEDHTIEFEDQHGTIGRLRCTGATVLYEGQPLFLAPSSPSLPPVDQASLASGEPARQRAGARRLCQRPLQQRPRRAR